MTVGDVDEVLPLYADAPDAVTVGEVDMVLSLDAVEEHVGPVAVRSDVVAIELFEMCIRASTARASASVK